MQSNIIADKKSFVGDNSTDILVLLNKISINQRIGKFLIPALLPTMDKTNPYDVDVVTQHVNTHNGNNIGTAISSNNIMVEVPKHLFYISNIEIVTSQSRDSEHGLMSCTPKAKIIYNEYEPGTKFLAVYDNQNNKNNPIIIGVM